MRPPFLLPHRIFSLGAHGERDAILSGLPAGSYNVGLCGTAPNPFAPWNNNGTGYTTAVIF